MCLKKLFDCLLEPGTERYIAKAVTAIHKEIFSQLPFNVGTVHHDNEGISELAQPNSPPPEENFPLCRMGLAINRKGYRVGPRTIFFCATLQRENPDSDLPIF